MTIHGTLSFDLLNRYLRHDWNRNQDHGAVVRMRELAQDYHRCQQAGVSYGLGSWGYTGRPSSPHLPYVPVIAVLSTRSGVLTPEPTVLRTAFSDEADRLWPTAMDKLGRWVKGYFAHYGRLYDDGSPDPTPNDDLARCFALDVLDDAATVAQIKELDLPGDLAQASQEHFRALTRIFDNWAEGVVGHVCGEENAYGEGLYFERGDNPRFCDFLVIDEGSLRSLAALPDETPPLDVVSREERLVGRTLLVPPPLAFTAFESVISPVFPPEL